MQKVMLAHTINTSYYRFLRTMPRKTLSKKAFLARMARGRAKKKRGRAGAAYPRHGVAGKRYPRVGMGTAGVQPFHLRVG